jgi:hypothetical protein
LLSAFATISTPSRVTIHVAPTVFKLYRLISWLKASPSMLTMRVWQTPSDATSEHLVL